MEQKVYVITGYNLKFLINTDTEEIGEIYIGCAGGINANFEIPVQYETNTFEHSAQITLKGLTWRPLWW